ncbi:MAG: carboxylesterase family protein [Verrucomicrobiaceae bacterium]|nr:carboxylesterase family protein [Verrucomicrobiaceae bacterium]
MENVSSQAYQYQFSRRSHQYPYLGAPHAIELTFVFNTLTNANERSVDQKIANQVTDYWVQFARTGDPNHEGAPQWPVYDSQERHYLNLDEDLGAGSQLKERECDVIDEASSK